MGSRQDKAFELSVYLMKYQRSMLIDEVRIRLLNEDASQVSKTSLFCGRRIGTDRIDLGLARMWLQEYHKSC